MIAKVKRARPGEFVLVDRNRDGRHEEAWFIDTSPRHTDAARPLLVRAIDEDGDLDADGAPDLDSDLYLADWKADGTVDAATDYLDADQDDDVDEMGIYYWSPQDRYLGKDALRVWWARDDGDDNQLLYDVDYSYDELLCAARCHFSGDETLVAFGLTEGSSQWQSIWENPFVICDADRDGCSDEIVRFSGLGDQVEALRWSFDADDDAHGRRTHNYDFSITALAPGSRFLQPDGRAGSELRLPAGLTETLSLRGIPTQPWLGRARAREFARSAPWARVMLTWDELNANTDRDIAADPTERWEGVIASGNKYFPRVGGQGPALNRRFELTLTPEAPLRLYYSPSDARVHLRGAPFGWLDADFDLDGKVDARYEWVDEDEDGYFDHRSIDPDADGTPDFVWTMTGAKPIDIDGPPDRFLRDVRPALRQALVETNAFVDEAIALMPQLRDDRVAVTFRDRLGDLGPATELGRYIQRSDAGRRYYLELLRDRALAAWKRQPPGRVDWPQIERLCAAGEFAKAAAALRQGTGLSGPPAARAYRTYRKRMALTVEGAPESDPRPIAIPVRALRERDPAFDPAQCAVVRGRWLDWQETSHQADDAGPSGEPTLTFLESPPQAGDPARRVYHVYYAPAGAGNPALPARTGTAADWIPASIGWESDRGAYRESGGQLGFFGKNGDRLLYPTVEAASYRQETRDGIDALRVGETSGLGGLTLYLDGQAYPVQDAASGGQARFTRKRICAGPVRAAVEITAGDVVPSRPDLTVRLLCLSYTSRPESEIRVTVSGSDRSVLLAPGLVKLPREQSISDVSRGILGSWGRQEPAIGDVGLAIVTDPRGVVDLLELAEERQIQCRLDEHGELRYWILGDWRRGRTYPVAPTVQNWRQEVDRLATRLLHDVRVEVGTAETVEPAR